MKKLTVLFLGLLAAATLSAAPFAQWFDFPGAGGLKYRIYGEGDEYSAWFEAEDGHAVWYNETLRGYEYRRKLADGSLAGTGILVGAEAGHEAELAAIPLHERDTSDRHANDRETRIRAKEERMGFKKNWEKLKANHAARLEAARLAEQGLVQSAPSSTTVGTIVGCTVLVDFPLDSSGNGSLWEQQHSSVTATKMENYLNGGEGVKEFGNACSVRQYYKEVSKGNLDYQNVLFGPVKLTHPRSYYDTDESDSVAGPRFVKDVIAAIKKTSGYSTKIGQVSKSGGKVRALNIFFAGGESPNWSKGLWAHSYSITGDDTFSRYQISACTGSPTLYVFCHENGHMICDFPDLYNYNGRSHHLVGTRCLMADRSAAWNPCAVSGYLRYCAGWVTPKDLPANTIVTLTRDYGDVYKYTNQNQQKEYYLIENRGGGRDSGMSGSGLIIWHCYQSGNNTSIKDFNPAFSDRTDNTKYRLQNVELTMEQADGEYHMERCQGYNANDFWFSGNPAAGYPGIFSDLTVPTARWMDGTESGLELSEFSAIGETMSFAVGTPVVEGAPTIADQITAGGYVGTGKLTVSNFGTGASSADVFIDIYGEATRKTLIASIQVATGLTSTSQKTYTFPLVADRTSQYVRFRVVNNQGKAAYGTLTEAVNGKAGDSSGGWGTTGGNAFGIAVDAPSLTISGGGADGYAQWSSGDTTAKKEYMTAPDCLYFHGSSTSTKLLKSTISATVAGPGTFTFYASSKLSMNGNGLSDKTLGNPQCSVVFTAKNSSGQQISTQTIPCNSTTKTSYKAYSVNLPSGNNTLTWEGSWIDPVSGTYNVGNVYIDKFLLEKNVAATIPIAKITTSSLLPDRATVGVQVTDMAGESSVNVTSIVVSPNSDYSSPVHTGNPGSVTGLEPLTRYYVKATLTGASGTTYPAIGSFVTPDWTKPTGSVTVSSVQHYSATVDVSVTNPGSENAADIVKTVTVAHDASFVEVLKSGVSVPCDLTGLEAGTTYYVRGVLTGPLTGDTYVETTFTTLSASYPLIGSVKSADVGTDRISVNVTVSGFGDGSSGGTVLVEAVSGDTVAASANGTASGVYELTGLDRDTSYTIRVTVTGSNGLSTTDESLVVKTLNVPVILADPKSSIGEEGASATMSARVAFREATVTDSNVKLYLTKVGESETLAKTWNSYAQGDVLSFAADTDPNVDYTYRFVATTKWNSKDWTAEVAGEFRTEYYVTNDWLTVDFESYEVDKPLPASDASGAWTKAVGGVYESASSVVDFASEFGKGKGLDQSGESTYAKYTATATRPDGIRCLFDADMYFTVCKVPPESLTDQVLATATTAIFLYSSDEANNFRVYTADGWKDVFAEGFAPASKTFHHVTIDVDYDVTPARVRFTVDGHLLADANGGKWFNRANSSKADKPTAVSVYGNTKLDGFSAKMLEYGNTACQHANKQQTSAAKEATCTEDGCTAGYVCPDCGRVWTAAVISALGHAWNNGEITKPASYRETGVMTYTCTRAGCGATRTETIEKPVCPHAHTTVTGASAATCTTAGSTGTETCDDCDAIIHTASVIAALGHDWDAGVVTLEPTRTAEGIKTFTCKRAGCGATQTEPIPMLPNIAAMRNIAQVATVGQTLTLPAKVRGLRPDATLAEEYAVSWQQSSVTPSSEGITTVTGTVTVSPLTFDVKATIRAVKVSNPDTTPANIAPNANGVSTSDVRYDGVLPTGSGKASTGAYSASAGDMTLTWTDDKIVSKAVIYFYSNKSSSQPTYSNVAFKNGTTAIDCSSPVSNKIYEKGNGSKDLCYQVTYNFTSPVTLSSLKITLPACQIEELEVYGTDVPTTATADPLTTDTLASLKVDNVAVPGFVSTTYSYTVTDGEAITSATATDNANMGITILPKDNEKAYVVTLAENGSTKTYTVSMPPSVVCTHEHTTVTGATDATCTAAGSTGTETCNDCHAGIREATVIPALGHDWSDWAVTKEASKTETGLRERNCQRVGCSAHEEEVIPMIVDIVALRNIAVVTAVGTAPTLPEKVVGLKADGTVGGEYDVVWNSASAPSAVGITTVAGTAQVNGTPMSVTASVRAANASAGEVELVNVAPLASSMVVTTPGTTEWNSSLADTSAITNGWGAEMTIGAWNNPGNYWQIYTGGNVALTVDVDFAWTTPKKISKIFIATRDDSKQVTITLKDGSGGNVISPTSYKIDQNDYYKINGGDGHLIEFSTPVELSALHIDAVKDPVGRMLGFFEIEVWAEGEGAGGTVDPFTTDTLTALAVDGTPIAGFAPTTYSYSVDNGTAISSAVNTDDNVGITILPKFEGSAYVVTLAENGTATQKYTVAMPFVEDPPVEVYTLTLDPKGGTVSSTTVDLPAQSLPTPTRDGYHFVGWFKDEIDANTTQGYVRGKYLCGEPLTSATADDKDTILYAKWVKNDVYSHFQGKKAVFVGDSVSTLHGYAAVNRQVYTSNIFYTEAKAAEQGITAQNTWWGQLVQALDMSLLSVNAVAGSPVTDSEPSITYDVRAMSSTARIDDLDVNGTPDVIFIFGGINDFNGNTKAPIDDYDPNASYLTNELDLTSDYFPTFAEGYATMLRRMRHYYPDAEIVAIGPYIAASDRDAYKPVFIKGNTTISNLCARFNVPYLNLMNTQLPYWANGVKLLCDSYHPNQAGFTEFANYVLENYVPACAHEHKTALTGVVAATCTTDGYSGDCTCEDCGETILGHVITKLGHDWGEWVTTKDPSTTETGLRERNCQRVGCSAHEEEVIPMIVDIAALRNIAVVTAVGTAPTLPAKVAGLKADGTVGGEYEVSWSPASVPDSPGITTVTGTAQVNGAPMSVAASVRAAVAIGGDLVNLTGTASVGIVSAVKTNTNPENWLKSIAPLDSNQWNDYIANVQYSNDPNTTELTLGWDSSVTVSEVAIYFNGQGGNYQPPANVKFYDDSGATPTEIAFTAGEVVDSGTVYAHIVYTFSSPKTLSKIRFSATPDPATNARLLFTRRMWVYGPDASAGGSVDPTTTDTLTALAVDGNAVAGFAATTYDYAVTNGTAITSATSTDNVGITILQKSVTGGDNAYVVTLAENGTATQKYTVAMPAGEDPPVTGASVTLNANGGTVASTTVDLPAQSLPTPTRDGYHFVGWFEDKTLTSYDFTPGGSYVPGTFLYGTPVTSAPVELKDKTLYAKWVKTSVYEHFHGKKVAVYGDSVSTLLGFVPSAEADMFNGGVFYGQDYVNMGINEHTQWWGQLVDTLGMQLLEINAIGGSSVGAYAYEYGLERKAMMNYTRMRLLDDAGTPDVIIVAAGINDYNDNTTGFNANADYLTNELDRVTSICPDFAKAYALMIRRLQDLYPTTEIVTLSSFDVGAAAATETGNDCIRRTCALYNVVNIDMRNAFTLNDGTGVNYRPHGIHPGISGFSAIANCFLENYAPIANPVVVPDCGHTWGFGVLTTPATATASGVRTYTCRHCSATKTEEVPYVALSEGTEADITSQATVKGVYLLPDDRQVAANTVDKQATPLASYNGYLESPANLIDGNADTIYKDWIMNDRYIAFTFDQPIVVTSVKLYGVMNRYPNKIQIVDPDNRLLGKTDAGIPYTSGQHQCTITTTERVATSELRLAVDFEYVGKELQLKEVEIFGYAAGTEPPIDPPDDPVETEIVALRNIAVVTAVGTAPTLPEKVAGLKADGTVSGEYDVVWETSAAPVAAGVTTVNGTAQVNGAPMDVTASVRAAVAGGELVNYTSSATPVDVSTESGGRCNNYLKSLESDDVASEDQWSDYIVYVSTYQKSLTIELNWTSPITFSKVKVYYWVDGGNYQHPGEVHFYNTSGGGSSEITGVTAGEPVAVGAKQGCVEYSFAQPQTLSQLKFVAHPNDSTGSRLLMARRFMVLGGGAGGGTVDPLTTDTLTALAVDGNAVAGFAPTTYSYTVENGTAITSATSTDNVGITILPKYEGSAYVVTLAENGTATKKYTVAMPAAVPQATVKIVDRSGKETTVTKPLDEIVDAINSAVASADYGSKVILPALDTDYTVTLAPGVLVVKNADSTGTVSLVIPSAKSGWYVLNEAGDAMKLSEGAKPFVTDIQVADGASVVTIGNVKVDLYYAVIKSETVFGFDTASVVATSGRIASGETFVFELPHGENEPQAFYKIVVTDDPAKADDPRGGGGEGGDDDDDDDPVTVDITQYTWCSLGTSITDFNDDPITGRTKGYQFFLMDELDWDRTKLVNEGHSGTLVSSSSSKPPATPCDIYTVEYGVNDWGTGHPVGTLDDYKNYLHNGKAVRWNNFASCYRNLIEMIKAVNPNAVIVLITPRKAYGSSSDTGTKMFPANCDDPTLSESVGDYYDPQQGTNVHGDQTYLKDYADLIKAIGEYEGFPVVDWYSSAATQANLASLSVDNAVHPNDAGYEIMAGLLKPVLLKAVQDKFGEGGGEGDEEDDDDDDPVRSAEYGPWNIQVMDPTHIVMQFDGAYGVEKNYVESGEFSTDPLTTEYNAIKSASFTVNGTVTAQAGHAIAARGQMSYTNALGQTEIVGGTGNQNWELRAVHNLYLNLASSLVEGTNTVVTPDERTLKFVYDTKTVSPLFKVNQVGYAASAAEKYVYLGGWMGTAGTFPLDDSYSFEVVNASSGATALTGSFTKRMNDTTSGGVAMTGEKTLEADISALTTAGTYYVRVAGLGRSMDFRVSDDAAADQFAVHMLGLYQQRCGCAKEEPYTHWTDTCCHQKVYRGVHPSNDDEYTKCFGGTAQSAFAIIKANADDCKEELTLPGGWHDAADYDRRPYHLQVVVDLANAYLMKPANFTDGQLAVPEKNNGIPDILDEADWGLKFYLAAQQQDDGGVGGWAETVTHPDYGNKKMPSDDTYKLQYYLGRATRRSTLKYCGAAANLARALYAVGTSQATARADTYKASAVKAWNYVMNSPRQQNIEMKGPNSSTVKYTEPEWYDPYEYAKAAINLGVITDDATYFNHLSDYITYRGGGRDDYNYGDNTFPCSGFFSVTWACVSRDESYGRTGFILSELGLPCAADDSNEDYHAAYQTIKTGWINRVKANADEIISLMTSAMAYRTAAPYGVSKMAWGACVPLKNAEWLCAAHFFTGDAKYLKAAQLASDYHSGCNPCGATWTSGLGKIYPVAFLSLHSFADSIAEYVPGITPYHNTGSDFGYLFNNVTRNRYTTCQSETGAKPWWRRFEVGENMSIGISEYTVTETIGPCAAASGYLINAGHTTANLNWHQPAAKLSDLPGYWALP